MGNISIDNSYFTVKKVRKGGSERIGILLPVYEEGAISNSIVCLLAFDGTKYTLDKNTVDLGITRITNKQLREAIDDVIMYAKKVDAYVRGKSKASTDVLNTYKEGLSKSIYRVKVLYSDNKDKMSVPLFNSSVIANLYHAGTMDIKRKRSYSLEGDGLSVSICPEEWRRITRQTESGLWLLQKKDVKMLDYHKLSMRSVNNIVKRGIEKGLATKGVLYDVESYIDDELCYSTYSTYEEAINETDIPFLDEEDDAEEYEEQLNRIVKREGIVATDKLKNKVSVDMAVGDIVKHLVLLYSEYVLKLDGVYWDDALDVLNYSAPRGVIFNSRLSSFSKTRLE